LAHLRNPTNQRQGVLPERGRSIRDSDVALGTPGNGADGSSGVSLGGVIGMCQRHNSVKARRVPQESVRVPVIAPPHHDDVTGKIEPLSAHTYRLATVEDRRRPKFAKLRRPPRI
jgi:hypothetical protein